jgi:geranylgeranyl pyrophosphate synthase
MTQFGAKIAPDHLTSDVAASYEAIRRTLHAAVLPDSPLDGALREWLTEHSLPPSLLIPVAAAGGLSPSAIVLSASMGFLLLVMRWLDDLVDQDREGQLWQVRSPGAAAVLASSALTHAWACLAREPEIPRDVLVAFGEMTAVLALGEHADAHEPPKSIAGWQRVAWRKTAVCFRFAAWAGARLTGDPCWERQASTYGEYLGLYLQAADDIAGAFDAGAPDLARGKTLTLPLVELLQYMPEAAEALRSREVDALIQALAQWDVRARCELQAGAYAREARDALRRCPGPWVTACRGLLGVLCGETSHYLPSS